MEPLQFVASSFTGPQAEGQLTLGIYKGSYLYLPATTVDSSSRIKVQNCYSDCNSAPDVLQRERQEVFYCWDVCRITGGSHIEIM
jgi:hypothetical protein